MLAMESRCGAVRLRGLVAVGIEDFVVFASFSGGDTRPEGIACGREFKPEGGANLIEWARDTAQRDLKFSPFEPSRRLLLCDQHGVPVRR
jgi:hypothetical protein